MIFIIRSQLTRSGSDGYGSVVDCVPVIVGEGGRVLVGVTVKVGVGVLVNVAV